MKKKASGSLALVQRLALAPYSVWAVIFIVVPLIFVAYYAFTDLDFRFTTDNITRFFTATSVVADETGAEREVHTYVLIFLRSLKLAAISTVICLIFGYPFAYLISKASPRTQSVLITLIMIPMCPYHRHGERGRHRHGLRLLPVHDPADLLGHGQDGRQAA